MTPLAPPQAELAPAALLNFRLAAAELYEPPYLRPELMLLIERYQAAQVPQGFGGVEPTANVQQSVGRTAAERVPKWAPK